MKSKIMDWITKIPISHRGLHKGVDTPENSILSFKKAIEKKYAIELDVIITKDKKIVVFHDEDLLRLCSSNKYISNEKYDSLKNFNLYKTSEKIPLFSEVLTLVAGQVPLLIEIKNHGEIGEFEEILAKQLDSYKGDFAICSFNEEVVFWFKQNRPSFLRALTFGDIKKFPIKFYEVVFIYRLFRTKPTFVSLDYKLLDTLIPTICKLFRKPLIIWTINSQKKLLKAKLKADNIIFENINI